MKNVEPIVPPETLKGMVYKQVKQYIVSGHLEPKYVYSANQFAEMLGVSRTPVREALLQLSSEGFLSPIKGRGFQIKELTIQEIKDFFETRQIIETYVVEHLVDEINKDDLEELDKCMELMKEQADSQDYNSFIEADKEFHMQLFIRYNNCFLIHTMEHLRNLISMFACKAISKHGRVEQVLREHQAIAQALHRKDKDGAIAAIVTHLKNTEKTLLKDAV